MCTVVFIPGEEKQFFASLRDESPLRAKANLPSINTINHTQFLAPIDGLAGGTWIGANNFGNIIILLNGGFENHKKKDSYIKSRGLIVKDLLQSKTPLTNWELMNLEHIEPFTLVIWNNTNLHHLVWDGTTKTKNVLNPNTAHIFSSSTLYNTQAKNNRKNLFDNWISSQPIINQLSVLAFFKSVDDKQNGFMIDRSQNLQTISYTFIEVENLNTITFNYFDFIANTSSIHQLEINKTTGEFAV